MIRCIQIGTVTVQGNVTATYGDPLGDFGKMRAFGGEIIGRLTPQERGNIEKFDSAVEGVTEHERLIRAEWVGFLRGRSSAFRDMAQERATPKRARYGDEELAEIKAWMAGE